MEARRDYTQIQDPEDEEVYFPSRIKTAVFAILCLAPVVFACYGLSVRNALLPSILLIIMFVPFTAITILDFFARIHYLHLSREGIRIHYMWRDWVYRWKDIQAFRVWTQRQQYSSSTTVGFDYTNEFMAKLPKAWWRNLGAGSGAPYVLLGENYGWNPKKLAAHLNALLAYYNDLDSGMDEEEDLRGEIPARRHF